MSSIYPFSVDVYVDIVLDLLRWHYRMKITAAQPNFKVLSLSNTANDLVLF